MGSTVKKGFFLESGVLNLVFLTEWIQGFGFCRVGPNGPPVQWDLILPSMAGFPWVSDHSVRKTTIQNNTFKKKPFLTVEQPRHNYSQGQ